MPQSPGRRRFDGHDVARRPRWSRRATAGGRRRRAEDPARSKAARRLAEHGRHARAGALRRLGALRRPAGAGSQGGAAHAAQLGRLRGRRLAARNARCRDRRARAVLGPAAGVGARPPRAHGHPARLADERHQLARLRLRRHASQDRDSSGGAGRLGASWRWRSSARCRARLSQRDGARRRGGVPHRQRGVSRPLRSRLAHHRYGRRVRRGGGQRQAAGPDRTADGLGARPRRDAAGRPARDVRLDDQELPSRARGAERPDRGAPGRRATSPAPRSGIEGKSGWANVLSTSPRLRRDHRASSARATRSRSTPTSRSPAASSSIPPSTPASSCATSTS